MAVTPDDIHAAIEAFPCLYEDQSGHRFIGCPVSGIPSALRENRWRWINRNFSDEGYLRNIGCETRKAQYVGGARPTGKFVPVVYVRPFSS